MVFAAFEPVQGGVRQPDLPAELRVGKRAAPFPQKGRQLSFQVVPHPGTVPQTS